MTIFNLGEFGDGNKYIIFSHDLKTPITSLPANTWTNLIKTGSGLDVTTSERGTKFQDVNGNESAYQFNTTGPEIKALDNEGHIKLRVERAVLCAPEVSGNGSEGDILSSVQYALSALSADGNVYALLGRGTSVSLATTMPATSGIVYVEKSFVGNKIGAIAKAILHTAGKSNDVNLDIFWKGKFAFFAVDGFVVNATDLRNINGTTPWSDIFKNFYLGSNRTAAGSYPIDYWFSNLEFRTKCPEFSLNYSSRAVGVLSDSLFYNNLVNGSLAGDVSTGSRILSKYHKNGQYINIKISTNGGYSVFNTGSNWLGDSVSIDSVVASGANKVLVSGGTNDALYDLAEITNSQFSSAILDILEKLLGENTNPKTKVESVIWLIPIPLVGITNDANYSTYVARAKGYRDILLGISSLWDTAYPNRAGIVSSFDSFKLLGGESSPVSNNLYKGQTNGLFNDLHPTAFCTKIWGDAIAAVV